MTSHIQSITGMNDLLPSDIFWWHRLEAITRTLFETYGFSEIRTPILEETRLFSRGIGEQSQVVQKEMYSFLDKGGDPVTMRPEGTASVMRAYIQHSLAAVDAITKLYYLGPMFRYERPQKGRLRQFHQIGAELMGIDSPIADAEVVIMMDRLTRALGITHYKLEVNSLGTLAERGPYLEKLVAYFEGFNGQLCPDCQVRVVKNPLRIFDCKEHSCKALGREAPTIIDALGEVSKQEFELFCASLTKAGVAYEVNSRLVRGLDYYEKTAFEFTSDRLGSQSTFSGGGRYNTLGLELGGKEVPSVGFSMGCERMILLMQDAVKDMPQPVVLSGVYFVPLDQICFERCGDMMQGLRDVGIKAERDYAAKSMKAGMRRANKLKCRYAVIMGGNELERGVVALKDLESGNQREVRVEALAEAVVISKLTSHENT